MSKFIDKLNSLNKDASPAMGFRRAESGEKHLSLLVAVELSGKPEDELKEAATTGAAAGILDPAGLSAAALIKYLKTKVDMPAGLVLGGGKTGTGAKAEGSDIDFIVFDMNLPVKSLEGNEAETVGKILRLDSKMEPGLLRAVNNLYPGVDAVMVDMRLPVLTIESLMNCRRVADFSGQPVVALAGKNLAPAELAALREAGVKCVVLPAGTTAAETVALIEDIKALPRPAKKKEKKGVAIVPRMGLATAHKEGEDDGGDDDNDD